MKYTLIFQPQAERHLAEWRKSGQTKILKKIVKLLEELTEHPRTGTGQVEQLKGNLTGLWSRRIDKGSRLIYGIDDYKVIVSIISMKGHYNDK